MDTPHMNTRQSSTGPATTPAPAAWPTLQAHDAPALIDFLVDTVGFLRTAVHEDGGKVAHAQLDWPEGGVMLGSYRPDTSAWCLDVVTDRVDELHARLSAPTRRATSGPSVRTGASPAR